MDGIKPFKQFMGNISYVEKLLTKASTTLKGFDEWDKTARLPAIASAGEDLKRAYWTLNNSLHVAGTFTYDAGLPQVIRNTRSRITEAVGHLNLHEGFNPEETEAFVQLALKEVALAKAVPESSFVGGLYPVEAFNIVKNSMQISGRTYYIAPSMPVGHDLTDYWFSRKWS